MQQKILLKKLRKRYKNRAYSSVAVNTHRKTRKLPTFYWRPNTVHLVLEAKSPRAYIIQIPSWQHVGMGKKG